MWRSSFCASASRVRADCTIPSNSFRDGASSLSLRILTRLSSSCLPTYKIPLRTDDENFRCVFYLVDHRSLVRGLAPPIRPRQAQRIDLSPQSIFRVMGGCIEVRIVEI